MNIKINPIEIKFHSKNQLKTNEIIITYASLNISDGDIKWREKGRNKKVKEKKEKRGERKKYNQKKNKNF